MKLMLSIMALGLLVAVGSAFEMEMGPMDQGTAPDDFGGPGHMGGQDRHPGGYDNHFGDKKGHQDFNKVYGYYDWLNPGGYYSYSYWYYPSYYWYPYTYPVTYTTPVAYPSFAYYYDPVFYDPWYATNVYGWTGKTYYSKSWSWSHYGGFFI